MNKIRALWKLFIYETLKFIPFAFLLIGAKASVEFYSMIEPEITDCGGMTIGFIALIFTLLIFLASMGLGVLFNNLTNERKIDTTPPETEPTYVMNSNGEIKKEKTNGFSWLLMGMFVYLFSPIKYVFNIITKSIRCILSSKYAERVLENKIDLSMFGKMILFSAIFMVVAILILGLLSCGYHGV